MCANFSPTELKKNAVDIYAARIRISRIFRMILSELLNSFHIIQAALEYFPRLNQSEGTMNLTACIFLFSRGNDFT